MKRSWCIPSVGADFVWRMEDILDLYAEPYGRRAPVVCFDESPHPLVREVRQPLPVAPGQPVRYDYEYRRAGTCNLFLFCQPLRGWRHVEVTDRRTAQDFAHCMNDLVDVQFPEARLISVVLANLNAQTPATLYETFAPGEARRILRQWDFRYTPKHGSWLNMAESEFAALATQGLDRRIPDQAPAQQEIAAWEARRNAAKASLNWQFTLAKARRRLQRLYPA